MKFEITSRWNSSVLFSVETDTLKLAVELGVKLGADLGGADLRGADLGGADLEDACLGGANLGGANLEGANLEGAYLEGAYLVGANLGGANLEDAYLRGAYLGGANGLDKFPIQIGGHKHWMITTPDGKLQIGCHVHTFEQWEKNAEKIGKAEGYSDMDVEIYKLHIQHIAKVARLLWAKQEAERKAGKEASAA